MRDNRRTSRRLRSWCKAFHKACLDASRAQWVPIAVGVAPSSDGRIK